MSGIYVTFRRRCRCGQPAMIALVWSAERQEQALADARAKQQEQAPVEVSTMPLDGASEIRCVLQGLIARPCIEAPAPVDAYCESCWDERGRMP